MKRICTLFVLAFIFIISTTPTCYTQTYGVKAGLNLANMSFKENSGSSIDNKMILGFHIGATAEFPIQDMYSFETGLLLTSKGTKVSSTYSGVKYETTFKPIYLEVPLTAKGNFEVSGKKVYGIFGPYLGVGIGGKIKTEGSSSNSESIKWGSGSSNTLKRLDYGLTIGGGIDIETIQVGISYGLGLANIASESSDGVKIHNRVFQISVGYKLGSLK